MNELGSNSTRPKKYHLLCQYCWFGNRHTFIWCFVNSQFVYKFIPFFLLLLNKHFEWNVRNHRALFFFICCFGFRWKTRKKIYIIDSIASGGCGASLHSRRFTTITINVLNELKRMREFKRKKNMNLIIMLYRPTENNDYEEEEGKKIYAENLSFPGNHLQIEIHLNGSERLNGFAAVWWPW